MRTYFPISMMLLVLLLLGMSCRAQVVPPEVSKAIDEAKKDCGVAVSLKKGFVTVKDVNGDGVPDYILDFGAFKCGDSASFYCGTAGCLTTVFASVDGHYAKVFDGNVRSMIFKKVRGRPAMVLDVHGSECGKIGAAACGETLYWNGYRFSPAH